MQKEEGMADNQELALMSHLFRRAGFGASRETLDAAIEKGYDQTVNELLNPSTVPGIEEDLLMRYQPSYYQSAAIETNVQKWMYYMINSPRQLQEKMVLMWHMIFCAGHSKIDSGAEMWYMIDMFRKNGMGNFKQILMDLSSNPGMVYYLDNSESHKTNINENYGRELLELFSLGVGKDEEMNYTEDDVKACARAFTGWNIAPAYPPFPYGRSPWTFMYDPGDHDNSEKTFLGQTGNFGGEDIIDIICADPATARFLARHLYNFFVADDVQVPAWRLTPPRDANAIEQMEKAYFDSGYEIKAMLEVLFNSDWFKAEDVRYAKVKNPAEMVVSVLRLTKDHSEVKPGLFEVSSVPKYMGMDLMNPPTVEGWHTGHEWIDSGTLVERINFAADYLGQTELPGVQDLMSKLDGSYKPEQFVDECITLVGALNITDETRSQLVAHAEKSGEVDTSASEFQIRTGEMFQMIAATSEYQFG